MLGSLKLLLEQFAFSHNHFIWHLHSVFFDNNLENI